MLSCGLRLLVSASLTACLSAIEILPYNPVAGAGAVVLSPDGLARFTVLTSRMLRLEYSQTGKFEDRATIAGV